MSRAHVERPSTLGSRALPFVMRLPAFVFVPSRPFLAFDNFRGLSAWLEL